VAAILVRLALGQGMGNPTDMAHYLEWADVGARHPLGEMYARTGANYPPGYMTIVWCLGKARSAFPILTRPDVRYLFMKSPAFVGDVLVGWLVYVIGARALGASSGLWCAALYLFNPAVISDSTQWGQTDGLVPLFPLLALYMLERKAWWAVGPFLAAAMVTKFQAVTLVIALAVFVLADFGIVCTLLTVAAGLLSFALISLPFLLTTGQFDRMLSLAYVGTMAFVRSVRLGALNFWDVVDPAITADDYALLSVHGIAITPKLIGFLLFALAAVPITLAGCARRDGAIRAFALGMVAWSFFMFPTEIHERYLLPAVAFFSVSAARGLMPTVVLAGVSGIHLYSSYFRYSSSGDALAPITRLLVVPFFLAAMLHLGSLRVPAEAPSPGTMLAGLSRWLRQRFWLPTTVLAVASVAAGLAVNGHFHALVADLRLTRIGAYGDSPVPTRYDMAVAGTTYPTAIELDRPRSIDYRFPPVFRALKTGVHVEDTTPATGSGCSATFSLKSSRGPLHEPVSLASGAAVQSIEAPLSECDTDLALAVVPSGCSPGARFEWVDPRLASWRPAEPWAQGNVTYLSDARENSSWLSRLLRGARPWHRDRSVRCNPLTIDGHVFTKGLGAPGGSILPFPVPEGASSFVTDVGYDDEVPLQMSGWKMQFVIVVDGREVFRSPELAPRQRISDVRIPLDGARNLTLMVDSAAATEWEDADWGDARFVRGPGS